MSDGSQLQRWRATWGGGAELSSESVYPSATARWPARIGVLGASIGEGNGYTSMAAEGPAHSLLFYYQEYGSSGWSQQFAADRDNVRLIVTLRAF